jgi:hypothetical protein
VNTAAEAHLESVCLPHALALSSQGHQQSALNAVRDLAVLETSLRSLHYSRQLRAASSFPKFKLFLKCARALPSMPVVLFCELETQKLQQQPRLSRPYLSRAAGSGLQGWFPLRRRAWTARWTFLSPPQPSSRHARCIALHQALHQAGWPWDDAK